MSGVRESWIKLITLAHSDRNIYKNDHTELKTAFEQEINHFRKIHLKEVESKSEKLYKKTEDKVKTMESWLETKVRTNPAHQYWQERGDILATKFKTWMLVCFLTVLLSVILISYVFTKLQPGFGNLESFVPFIVASSFCVVVIRLVSRIMLSYYHLASEADERQTMVSVFLALLQNDSKPLADGERELMLRALFRSSGSGLGSDNSGSSLDSLITLVTKTR